MTAETLPEIAARTADTAGQAVDSADDSTAASQRVKDLHTFSHIARTTIAEFKTNTEGKLRAGVEAKELIAVYGPVVAAYDRCLARVRPFLEKHKDYGDDYYGRIIVNFVAIERDMTETRDRLTLYITAAKRPLPAIDPESLNRGRADAAAGRVESAREIAKRLQAGEDF